MPGHLPTKCVEKVCCGICGKGSHQTALCCKNPETRDAEIVPQTKEWCVFSNKHKNSTDCHVVKTYLTRLDRVKALGLCNVCLKSHPMGPCSDVWVACEYCEKSGHHKAVCTVNPFLEENAKTDPTKGECMFCLRHMKPAECTIVTRMASSTKCCTFCSNRHSPVGCQTYPTVSVRQDRLNELRRCYRCLETGHIPPQCQNYVECRFCGGTSHHASMCWKNKQNKDFDELLTNERCAFCAKHNDSSCCKTVRTHRTRMDRALSFNLCPICLDKCHPSQPCKADALPCGFCNATTHHKALCPRNQHLEENFEADPSVGPCIFCGTHNKPGRCNQKDLQVRLNLLASEGRCQKCLRRHPTENCGYRNRCLICRSPNHHNVICPLDPALTNNSVPFSPSSSTVSACLNSPASNNDYAENFALTSPFSAPSSPSNGYCSDDSSEPAVETVSLSSSTFSDTTWQREVHQNVPESKLHIWLGPKKRSACHSQNRPPTPDYTIEHLASLMAGCGLPEAPKNSHAIKMPFNYNFY